MSQSEWSDTGQFRSGQQWHWRSFLPLCWPCLLLEFQATIAATSALSDNTASRKKKRGEGWRREDLLCISYWRENYFAKNLRRLPIYPMVRTGTHALPRVIKRDVLQGSHTFSLCSGRRASPAKKVMVNPPWEGRQHRLPLSPVPTPRCSR